MAISPRMKKALHALSYATAAEVGQVYHLERAVRGLRAPLAPLYRPWDKKVLRKGREIRVRLYHPRKKRGAGLLLFFHGGGWVLESIDTYNNVCRTLSNKTGLPVASVEYGLAPEHLFPTAAEDCYAVAKAVFEMPDAQLGFDKSKITLIGDSAGGNLAAAVSLMARDRGEFAVPRQILIYPATYNDHTARSPYPSVVQNGSDYLLTSRRVEEFMQLYAGGDPSLVTSPYFAPLLAERLDDQPHTLVITAEFDPLRDEGEAYAAALHNAGVQVHTVRMADGLHGFFSLPPRFSIVRQCYTQILRFLTEEGCIQ